MIEVMVDLVLKTRKRERKVNDNVARPTAGEVLLLFLSQLTAFPILLLVLAVQLCQARAHNCLNAAVVQQTDKRMHSQCASMAHSECTLHTFWCRFW